MNDLVALRRSARLLWTPAGGEVIPIHTERDLAAQVGCWTTYGETATVRPHSESGRQAAVTSLGDDGWLLKVRHARMVKRGWSYSRIVTRESGETRASQWYLPNESTDLAGSTLFPDQIEFSPVAVAGSAWAWLTTGNLPERVTAGQAGYDLVVVDSVAAGLEWIASSGHEAWPADAGEAASDLASELRVDRVVVTSPRQILLRSASTERRMRWQCRNTEDGLQVQAIGLADELGRDYSIRLPDRSIVRISRRGPAS